MSRIITSARVRKVVLGLAAAAGLGLGALSFTSPASAQSWSLTIGQPSHGFGHGGYVDGGYRPVRDGWDHGWRGGWREHGGYGRRGGYDGGYGFYGAPRCVTRTVRYWDGWGWAVERRRVCN